MSTPHRLDACGDPLPSGVVQRLGVRRLKHTLRMGNDRAEAACFSPDGRLLAVYAEEDERISLWSVPDGRLVRMLDAYPASRFHPLTFTPDGRWLFTNSTGCPVVWEAGTWAEVVKPYGRQPAGWRYLPPEGDAGLSPESRRLRQLVARLCPARVILSLASSGAYLVTSNEERQRQAGEIRLEVWRVADGERTAEVVLGPLDVHGFPVDPVVSPDGRWLSASMHGDPVQIQDSRLSPNEQLLLARVAGTQQSYRLWRRVVWDLAGVGDPVDVLTSLYPILGSWFSPDGRLLLVSNLMEGLHVWDCAARRFLWKANGGQSYSVGLAEGRVAVPLGNKVAVFELATGETLATVPVPADLRVDSVALSAGPAALLAVVATNGLIELRDVETGREVTPLERLPHPVEAVAFTPDGRSLATVGRPLAVLWDLPSGRPVARARAEETVRSPASVRAAGGVLSLLSWHRGLCVYDWTTGQLRARVPAEDVLQGGSWPERDLGVVCIGKPDYSRPINPASVCEIRRLSTGEVLVQRSLKVLAIALAPGGMLAIAGGRTVRLFDLELRQLRAWPSPFPVRSRRTWAAVELAFSPDGSLLALGVRCGGQVGVASWDVRGGNELGRASWPAPDLPGVPDCGTDHALRLGFGAGAALAAVLHEEDDESGPDRCSLHAHEGRTGAEIAVIDLERDPVFDWAFSPDGQALAVTRDNTVEIWALEPSGLPA
jgi:WD40 repeat protein